MRINVCVLSMVLAGCVAGGSDARGPTMGQSRAGMSSRRMLVTTQATCMANDGRTCLIIELVDTHTAATSEDKGFDELRARASALGADAVMAAEFEHGEADGPSHLSAMIVRYGDPVPPHEVIGELDIPSDPASTAKGMEMLLERAKAMGGSRVIGVTFEHGEEGQQGHLRGSVIRYLE